MNKIMAMIANGVVQNIAIWDGVSTWQPSGFTLVDISNLPDVIIGSTYDGKNFTPPLPGPVFVDPIKALEADVTQIAAKDGVSLIDPLAAASGASVSGASLVIQGA